MTESQKVIKALECCHEQTKCRRCPYKALRTQSRLCKQLLHTDAPSLIARQSATIDGIVNIYNAALDKIVNDIHPDEIGDYVAKVKTIVSDLTHQNQCVPHKSIHHEGAPDDNHKDLGDAQ